VPERRVAEVVRKRHRFGEVLVEAEGARDGARDLRGFHRVRQARSVVVAFVVHEDLRLVLETAKRAGVDDAVAIALERHTERMLGLRIRAAAAIGGLHRVRGQAFSFPTLEVAPVLHLALAPEAAKSIGSRGRLRPEAEDDVRPAFQRDRDRIIHSKAFRRLKHKTQVFFAPAGDHYRTRLTHSLEVSQIARTIAKVLRLHEELTEAISLGHDLGHTPFGHAGEQVLDTLVPGGFRHYEQSLRIVDVLEGDGHGLNLSWEVRDGIGRHSKGKNGSPVGIDPDKRSSTLEGQVMRVADLIAYVNHDIDDAVRAGVLREDALPPAAVAVLGDSSSARIARMVKDVVTETSRSGLDEIRMSEEVLEATLAMRAFLFSAVYENETATAEFKKAAGILGGLWERVRERPGEFLDPRILEADGVDTAAKDFVAGMTDRFAVALYERLFIPRPWVGPLAWT